MSILLSISPSVCPSVHISVCPVILRSVHLSVCPSVCPTEKQCRVDGQSIGKGFNPSEMVLIANVLWGYLFYNSLSSSQMSCIFHIKVINKQAGKLNCTWRKSRKIHSHTHTHTHIYHTPHIYYYHQYSSYCFYCYCSDKMNSFLSWGKDSWHLLLPSPSIFLS